VCCAAFVSAILYSLWQSGKCEGRKSENLRRGYPTSRMKHQSRQTVDKNVALNGRKERKNGVY
jgi:hypothetical protein